MNPITYISDQPADYAKALTECKTLEDLLLVTAAYESIAPDAREVALSMDEAAFRKFKRGMHKERRGQFAGEEWAMKYGAILMPEIMLKVGLAAQQFCAPWGLVYLRLKEAGKLPTCVPSGCKE